jgi:hypothetical protein
MTWAWVGIGAVTLAAVLLRAAWWGMFRTDRLSRQLTLHAVENAMGRVQRPSGAVRVVPQQRDQGDTADRVQSDQGRDKTGGPA